MESENGVTVEEEKRVIEITTKENLNKEVQNDYNGTEIQIMNDESIPKAEAEKPNSAKSAIEASVTSSARKTSKTAKESFGKAGVAASKNNKSTNLKNSTSLSQKQRPILSHSLSFPAKPARGDSMKKSVDGHPVRAEAKRAQGNGIRPEAPVRHASKVTNSEVNSKEAKSSQRASLTSSPSMQHSAFGRSTPVNAVAKSQASEASPSIDQISNTAKSAKPNKEEEEDAYSTTSISTPRRRSSGSGFSFRLEERAEKRKEFFSKLEEKIQAKEAEKTNLQEKSKESQVAEIKKLRKSMTFKATPMPTFYKEPPPKVELKKIPTTRAISPKLGRHKGSAVNNNSEENSCSSPQAKQQQKTSTRALKEKCDKDVISRKPIRKSQAKIQSQGTATSITEGESVRSAKKFTERNAETQNEKACPESNEESQDACVYNSESKNDIQIESEKNIAPNSALVLNSGSAAPEIVSYEVTVGV